MSHAPGNGIEDLYRSVMTDVISQCKEAFLDENVDVDILFQIQKIWEEKVNESGAVDLNPKPNQMPVARPSQKPGGQQQGKSGPGNISGQQQESGPSTSDPQNLSQYINPELLASAGVNLLPQMQYPQFVLPTTQQVTPGVMMVSVDASGNFIHLTPDQLKTSGLFPQVDGGNDDFGGLELDGKPEDYKVDLNLEKGELIIKKRKKRPTKSKKSEVAELTDKLAKLESSGDEAVEKEKQKLLMLVPQVDGGPEMSDSDSDDEEDEDEHISRMVERIEDRAEAEEEDPGDEEPLNSDDDQSDDEDLDTLFESNNIIVCQFEKVNRARTKWKFTLKDGIMHLDGKDYCFQKCTGEAEW